MTSLCRTLPSVQSDLHQSAPQQTGAPQQPVPDTKKGGRRRSRAPSIAKMCLSRSRRSLSVDSADIDLDVSGSPSLSTYRALSMSQDALGGQEMDPLSSELINLECETKDELALELVEKTRALELMSACDMTANDGEELCTRLRLDHASKQDEEPSPNIPVYKTECSVETVLQRESRTEPHSVVLRVPTVSSSPAICDPAGPGLDHNILTLEVDNNECMGLELGPPLGGRRSNSFDHATVWPGTSSPDDHLSSDQIDFGGTSSLTVPKPAGLFRRASWEIPKICLHCMHLETLEAARKSEALASATVDGSDRSDLSQETSSCSESSTSSSDEDEESVESPGSDPVVRFTLDAPEDCERAFAGASQTVPAIVGDQTENPDIVKSQEPSPHEPSSASSGSQYKDVVSLAVPVVKQRSTSMDAACMLSPPSEGSPGRQARSRSVDANVTRKASNTLAILALVHQSFK
ncbi:hypothetical protein PoB_001658100 [Plakobranchus ocellatus]|uniref:Uncharacterized protein n=1 Tax=Plakobranchus ocellatus TaxID=259542 RepID=A0AAV3Z2J9_9GAST|nr:hypothetical protein PoB_001658100 [Plakobranchus ocellatus]